ncbi:hypothetical protein [Methyloceanibacter sp. wino2]|uniref:hypothetical protein n=1 Tax=Methyloceanibacter sp. wino2 TaxID=2170729 RepID=UPI00131EF7C3|nr:hypothetical protein [Methyloceanibacter sp. wino2]
MSILSLLTSVVLVGLVYGLSFVPSATLTRSDDEIEFDQIESVVSADDSTSEDATGGRA